MTASRTAPALGTVIRGRYTLERFLGAGGMAAVYEARDADDDTRRVAVKVLTADANYQVTEDSSVDRFEREMRLAATLASAHIVPAIDAGMDPALGLPFMVMPLLVGFDLGALLRKVGPLHPAVASRIVRQICAALEVAHERDIIHRDIKPANVFLDHDSSGKVTVRLFDFGIAKCFEHRGDLTQTGAIIGTPGYMAPEQVTDSKDVDGRTDVWATAVTLFRALSAKHPFAITGAVEAMVAVLTDEPQHLQDHAPWIDPALAAIVHGAMLKDRTLRCPSAAALRQALAPFTLGTDALDATMFERLPEEHRRMHAARADVPLRWELATPTEPATEITQTDADPLIGRTLTGGLRLLRNLGKGGMGAVYEADDDRGARVAVKVIRPELCGFDSTTRKRFAREAQALARIQSPHVVRVIAVEHDAALDLPFIVMEMLHGRDLKQLIAERGALPAGAVARLFVQACHGLAASHASGFIHRDVKPANLFLHNQPDGTLTIKVCDFGVAKHLTDAAEQSSELTRTGGMIGSPLYMSPEQAQNAKQLDPRSDVWSLGISLYEALAGAPPWDKTRSMGEILVLVCTREAPLLAERAPWLDAALARVVQRCLCRDPAARFATAMELAAALEPFTGGIHILHGADLDTGNAVPSARVATSIDLSLSGSTRELETTVRHRRRRWPIAAAVLATLGVGGVAWLATRSPEVISEPTRIQAETAPSATPPAVPHATGAPKPSPPPEASASAMPRGRRVPGPATAAKAPVDAPSSAPKPAPATLTPREDWK